MTILEEMRRLHALGLSLHWLYPKEKRPIGEGWPHKPRRSIKELEATYKEGNNLGTRLGKTARLGEGYHCVIDCDVNSSDPKDLEEMEKKLLQLFGKSLQDAPTVFSGSGNGGKHIHARTRELLAGKKLAHSVGKTKVIKEGKEKEVYLWEIEFFGQGKQVVIPPSIHPDSGKPYRWKNGGLTSPLLPFIEIPDAELARDKEEKPSQFKFETVDLIGSDLPDKMVNLIISGENSFDRSAEIFWVCRTMWLYGYTDNQIKSVLVDKNNFLASAALERREHGGIDSAAEWIQTQCLDRMRVKMKKNWESIDPPPPLSEEDAEKQFRELFPVSVDWRTKLELNQYGKPKQSMMNVIHILEGEFGEGLFHKDEFALRRTYGMDTPWGGKKGTELNDDQIIAIVRYIAERYRLEPKEHHVVSAMVSLSSRNSHHPVRDYLDSLEWDGVPRIDTWLRDFAKVRGPKPYLRAISRKVLCAMVARAYYPGTKFDYVLVLEGPLQGEGKSRSIRAIASPPWAGSVRFDMDHKDFVLALQGRWITEISELSGLSRRDTSFVKAVVSEEQDRIRQPYGRLTESLPRQGIFIGTTNHFQYLEDETGNRRFWPVRVKKIDVEGLEKIRDQLFAEAKVCWGLGEELWLDEKTEKLAHRIQEKRLFDDTWGDTLQEFLDKPENKDFEKEGIQIKKLFGDFGPFKAEKDSEKNIKRAARILRILGFVRVTKKDKKTVKRFWVRKSNRR